MGCPDCGPESMTKSPCGRVREAKLAGVAQPREWGVEGGMCSVDRIERK